MSGDEYIRALLQKYRVDRGPTSPAETAGNAVAAIARRWAGSYLNSVTFSGSYAKGTAVTTGSDIDVFISLLSNTPGTLKELYEGIFATVGAAGYPVRRQNVSVRATVGAIDVDIVPGRVQAGHVKYHSLYKSKKDSWTQTNVEIHIDTVTKSARLEEIQAIKVWRDLRGLEWPSFYLELTVIEALKYHRFGQPATNVWRVLEYIVDDFPGARVVDPANTNNIISDDLTAVDKLVLAGRARESRNSGKWDKIIW